MSSKARDISEEIGSNDWMLLTYIHDRKEGEIFKEDNFKTVEDEDSVEAYEDEAHEEKAHYVVIHMTRTEDEQDEPKAYKNFYKVLEDDDGHKRVRLCHRKWISYPLLDDNLLNEEVL